MVFLILVLSVVMVVSTLGFAFLTTGFFKYRKREWLVIWYLFTFLMIALYFGTTFLSDSLSPSLRIFLLRFSLVWLLLQCFLILAAPLWLSIAVFRGIFQEKQKISEQIFEKISSIVVIMAIGFSVITIYFPEPWRLVQVEVASETIPEGLDGLKVAQITDTHILYPEHLQRLKAQISGAAAAKADILVFGGDFVDENKLLPEALQIVKEMEKEFPLGVWFILGNHEYLRGIDTFLAEVEKKDVRLLKNEGISLSYYGTPFYLAGVDYPFPETWRQGQGGGASADLGVAKKDLEQALLNRPKNVFTILAAHHPASFDFAFEQGVPLSFAGHTHGYQVGWNGRSLNFFARYAWGLYGDAARGYGYVSGGAGAWFPIRLGVPEEVVIFTLKKVN